MIQNYKLRLANRVSRQQIESCQKECGKMQKCALKDELRVLLCELQVIKQTNQLAARQEPQSN